MKWPSFLLALLAVAPLAAEPVTVGQFAAKIVPEQLSVLTLPGQGTVTDWVESGRVSAGAVIAILDKQRMEEEREDMEFQLAKDRIARRDEMRQLRQQREKLVFYLNLSEGERKYAEKDLAGSAPATRESLRDLDERIALVQRELDTMEKRRRNEFDRQHEGQILRMPFNGRLQYNISMPEESGTPFDVVGSVQIFATACDDSAYYVTIAISRSDLSLLPENKFSVRVPLPEGRQLVAPFAFRRVEKGRSGDMLVYFFRLPAEDADTAFGMLGSNTKATLLYEVDGSVERVSKASLAAHPAAGECESWQELVGRAHPGAVLVLVGDRDVVIRHAEGAALPPAEGSPEAEGSCAP